MQVALCGGGGILTTRRSPCIMTFGSWLQMFLTSPQAGEPSRRARDRRWPLLPTRKAMQMFNAISSETVPGATHGSGPRRTFARLTAFDLACPRCGTVDSVSCLRPWWKKKTNFDPWRSRWRCRVCRRVFAVGLALWPVSRAGNRPREARPADTIPTMQQLLGLKLLAERGWHDPVNLICECLDEKRSITCPLHACGSP